METKLKKQENSGVKGRITIRSFKAGTLKRVQPYFDTINKIKKLIPKTSEHRQKMITALESAAFRIMNSNQLSSPLVTENLIMKAANIGKDLIIQRLTGTTTYSLVINYGAIGTGSTAPSTSDTKLTAETNRVAPAYVQDIGFNEAQLQFFFPDGILANGTYPEFGTFVDGTSSANSGQIFNHALFGTSYVKTAGVDTTVEVDITLT